MSDQFGDVGGEVTGIRGNAPEFTVSELANSVKRTLEGAFGLVRVRGEIGKITRPASGHVYLTLKDENAALESVVWRGSVARLGLRPEQGMEVVCTGRITTYPGRSQYQLVIERMELAGEGALLKLLEDRKRRLAAEGLFDAAAKRALPYLPRVVGVVTSPTGAVIRDILHRLSDRFPVHVLVWPARVQGDGAAEEIAAAIDGFDALPPGGRVPRPDLVIVARGGGSLEDLMPFNEEIVVRAAARCRIPLISAVGHETDTTLIDFAADRRAPTPSAAAEMAVPVRTELLAETLDRARRLETASARLIAEWRLALGAAIRGLGDPARLLEPLMQRLDDRVLRLERSASANVERGYSRLEAVSGRLRHPRQAIEAEVRGVAQLGQRLDAAAAQLGRRASERAGQVMGRLDPASLMRRIASNAQEFARVAPRLEAAPKAWLARLNNNLDVFSARLDTYSFEKVLRQGYAIVIGEDGHAITDPDILTPGRLVDLRFHGRREVPATIGRAASPSARKPRTDQSPTGSQGSLL